MFNALKRKLGKKGFTLIELIVVIAIIAILAVILIPRFMGFTDSANIKSAVSDTRNILLIVQALETEGKPVTIATPATALKEINEYAAGKTLAAVTDYQYQGTLAFTNKGTFSYKVQKGSKDVTVHVVDYKVVAGAPETTYLPAITDHS